MTYSLSVDDSVVYVGDLASSPGAPGVGWGDATDGASSLSVWQYVRFGVVPEPSAALLIISVGLAGVILRARSAGTVLQS
ncbi:MAG: PEP-CTERM sorting domain-containing protein [Phycisphaerae bacterium]|nr:PEP-CTERM sorting domain-containing protein [Phycisphaerae bacterium]